MGDVQKELQKLKALINQRPTTAIFSNKSNESDKIVHGDAEFFINEMSKKFVFTRSGIKHPVMVDPQLKALENVEYLNGTKVDDLTASAESLNELRRDVNEHEDRIITLENEHTDCDARIMALETHSSLQDKTLEQYGSEISSIKNKNNEQDRRIEELENGESTTGIVKALTEYVRTEPLTDLRYTFDNSMPGYFKVIFDPPITVENFKEGHYSFMQCTLISTTWELAWKKTKTETGYEIDLYGGTLENGIFTFPHGTDQRTSKVIVFTENLIKPIYELKDDKFTDAIVESTGTKITNNLITFHDYTVEPLEVKYTYTTENGYFIMTFEPRITEDNLPEGNKTIVRFTLDNGYVFNANYNKYKADEKHYVLYWYDEKAKFANGILKYNHGYTGVSVKTVEFSLQLTKVNPKYELRNENLTEAVIESISPKMISTVKDSLIQYKTVEIPIYVSYTFTPNTYGYFEMRFNPPITEDNLPEGHFIQMLEFTLTNGNHYIIYYSKFENDDGTFTVGWYDTNGSLADGVFIYRYPLYDVSPKSAVVNIQFIQRQSRYELRDIKLTEAIVVSAGPNILNTSTVRDNLIQPTKVEKPLEVSYKDYSTPDGYFRIKFDPAIGEENLPEGESIHLLDFGLTNGHAYIIRYSKYKNDDGTYTVIWNDENARLRDGYFSYKHTFTDVYSEYMVLYGKFIQMQDAFELRDETISDAIIKSIWNKMINEKFVMKDVIVNGNLEVAGAITSIAGLIQGNLTVGTLNGCKLAEDHNYFYKGSVIPIVHRDGVMEIGQYIDFHSSGGAGNDYDVRLIGTPGLLRVQGGSLDVAGEIEVAKGRAGAEGYGWSAIKVHGVVSYMASDGTATHLVNLGGGGLYAWSNVNGHYKDCSIIGGSQTITHKTNVSGEIGTFCEATGEIYDGYKKIKNTDCICAVKQTDSLNPRIVGIICDIDEFASHGDVLVKIAPGTYEIGDILCPDENGYGRKASEDEEIFMMMKAIPRPKITALNIEGYDGFAACFLV